LSFAGFLREIRLAESDGKDFARRINGATTGRISSKSSHMAASL
jgi:hypothetical protein